MLKAHGNGAYRAFSEEVHKLLLEALRKDSAAFCVQGVKKVCKAFFMSALALQAPKQVALNGQYGLGLLEEQEFTAIHSSRALFMSLLRDA